MKFNSETGRAAGRKSKRGKSYNVVEIREKFQELIENNLDQLNADLRELESKDRIECIIKLARFVMPQLKAIEIGDKTAPIELPIVMTPDEARAELKRIRKAGIDVDLKEI